ncbi:hypothetical protein C5167_018635 [Papaver somniferum]|uniref:Uncharacterized protein n=1 Tax=Papaver somniferum TaxID=3469 RepID=A0A4Y7IR59_PAPSO|nr:uncharacterized protein LOC113353624 [Papaver somniferum]RZC50211.1 hypothetical protein C5167_018635 [Papaver somniferum]
MAVFKVSTSTLLVLVLIIITYDAAGQALANGNASMAVVLNNISYGNHFVHALQQKHNHPNISSVGRFSTWILVNYTEIVTNVACFISLTGDSKCTNTTNLSFNKETQAESFAHRAAAPASN